MVLVGQTSNQLHGREGAEKHQHRLAQRHRSKDCLDLQIVDEDAENVPSLLLECDLFIQIV